jgi:pimeloyl-ACP methyl ester carboxylesterase
MLNEKIAKGVGPAGIDIAYARLGKPSDPPVLLIMGLAAQLVTWPAGFLEALLSRELQLVIFDNRDAGRSTHMKGAPMPDLPAALAGDFASASYTLADMAADAVGLLDVLGIQAAHLVGASMGGAIAQTIAIEHPRRVLSLTSIMASTGDPAVGQIDPETRNALFGGPPALTRDEVIARAIRTAPLVRSPAYPTPAEEIAERVGLAWDRDHDLLAVARQAVASVAAGDRTARLRKLAVPTLVIHGTADRMCDPSGGRATAAAIPGAELVLVDGMGHDLPPGLWNSLADLIAGAVRQAEKR